MTLTAPVAQCFAFIARFEHSGAQCNLILLLREAHAHRKTLWGIVQGHGQCH